MRKSDYEEFKLFVSHVGGTTRYLISVIISKILNKQHPSKTFFINGPDKKTDYFGAFNNSFRNIIATIIVLFILVSLLFKLVRVF